MPSQTIRITCGIRAKPRKVTQGSILAELMAWCCFAAATSPTSADEHRVAPIRIASAATPENCHASDVALDQLRSQVKRGYIYIVGRVVNNCDIEAGVQIKVAILDHAGGILHVANFWPASNDNIPAHSGFPFQTMIDGAESFDRFQVTVIAVKRWAE